MKTLFPLTLTGSPQAAVEFYRDLFGFEVMIDVGWYVQLVHPDDNGMQIAFMADDHDSVPAKFRAAPAGVVITLEFDDADQFHARAKQLGLPIHVELRDEEWGQRHFITEDPTGLLVDVVQPIAPTQDFLERHGLLDA